MYEERELVFSDQVETILASAAQDMEIPVDKLRARYRHSVLVDKMVPSVAAEYAASTQFTEVQNLPEIPEKITVLSLEEYSSPEHAIFALAEYSGLGHEIVPALRASWVRAVQAGEDPFDRAKELAIDTYYSPDADLLPRLD